VTTLGHIERLERFQEVPYDGPMYDLLWSDPEAKVGDWAWSDHGEKVLGGLRPSTKFLNLTG
jgi:diadenosine tetraphosphatase ApaH/serine/threonine PP2A family protein phosphatase